MRVIRFVIILSMIALITFIALYLLGGFYNQRRVVPVADPIVAQAIKDYYSNVAAVNPEVDSFKGKGLLDIAGDQFSLVPVSWNVVKGMLNIDPRQTSSPSAWFYENFFNNAPDNRIVFLDPRKVGKASLSYSLGVKVDGEELRFIKTAGVSYDQFLQLRSTLQDQDFLVIGIDDSKQGLTGNYNVNYFIKR